MSPVKSMSIYVDNGDFHSLREIVVSDYFVISKPKRGRPRKSGRALEVDDVVESVSDVTNNKKLKVKHLVHFQPRS